MVLFGTVDGRLFVFEEAVNMIRNEFVKFPSPMSIPQLHERTGLDGDGILAIVCYLEFCSEVKSYRSGQIVKWVRAS